MRDFLLRLAREQKYDQAFAATIGVVGLPRVQQAWVEWVRALR